MSSKTIDLHIDFCWQCHRATKALDLTEHLPDVQVDFQRMKTGGLDKFVAPVYLSDKCQSDYGPTLSWNAVKNQLAIIQGYGSLIPALEGGRLLQESKGCIDLLADAGCVYITLAHNKTTSWADSATDNLVHNGLTAVGKRITKWIEDAGILIDVSHAADATIFDVLALAARPVIASHSGVLSLVNHPRNLSDALIKMIAATGGVIGIPYARKFVKDRDGIVLAIDHIAQMLGNTRHIAIGSDLDGAETVVTDAAEWSQVLDEPLANLGYTPDQVDGIKGENFSRLLEAQHG